MIRLTKKDLGFSDIRWVLRAKSDDGEPIRGEQRNVLHSGNGNAVCTDGFRLHSLNMQGACCFDIPDGNYVVIKNTQQEIVLENTTAQFPDCSNLFLDTKKMTPMLRIEAHELFDYVLATIIRKLHESNTVNVEYLKDILSTGCHFDIFQANNGCPLHFINGTHTALLMPMRI